MSGKFRGGEKTTGMAEGKWRRGIELLIEAMEELSQVDVDGKAWSGGFSVHSEYGG